MGKDIRASRNIVLEQIYKCKKIQLEDLASKTRFNWGIANTYLKRAYPNYKGKFPKVFDKYPELIDSACNELEKYQLLRTNNTPENRLLLRAVRISLTLVERLIKHYSSD